MLFAEASPVDCARASDSTSVRRTDKPRRATEPPPVFRDTLPPAAQQPPRRLDGRHPSAGGPVPVPRDRADVLGELADTLHDLTPSQLHRERS